MVYCNFKRVLFVLLVLFILFSFFSCSLCATVVDPSETISGVSTQYDNTYLTLYNMQYTTQTEFINYCYANYDKPLTKQAVTTIYNQFQTLGLNSKFMTISETSDESGVLFDVYFGFLGSCTPSSQNITLNGYMNFTNVPMLSGTYYRVVRVLSDNIIFPDLPISMTRIYAYCQCVHDGFPQLFKDFGLIDNVKDYTSSLGNIKTSIDRTNAIMEQVNNSIKSESGKVQDTIKDSTNTITDTLTDNDVSDIDVSGIQSADTTEDITSDGFNNIFTSIQSSFLDDSEHSVDITIPFINMPLTISKSSIFGNFSGLSVIENLCSMVWYFLVSIFIVKDISKKINAIKSGNIENVQNTNIKEDLL